MKFKVYAYGANKELSFEDEKALYHYVLGFDYINRYGKKGNSFLDSTMTHPSDIRHLRIMLMKGKPDIYYKGFLVKDRLGRTIDLRNYEKELYRFDNAEYIRFARKKKKEEHDEWWADREKELDKANELFHRNMPSYIGMYRNIRTTQERRHSCYTEHKPYVRGKRRGHNLPDSRNAERLIAYEKTWKVRIKAKRQWQANLLIHIDTVHRNKRGC